MTATITEHPKGKSVRGVALYNNGLPLWAGYRVDLLKQDYSQRPTLKLLRNHVYSSDDNLGPIARFESEEMARQLLMQAGFVEIANAIHGKVWVPKDDKFIAVAGWGWGAGPDLHQAILNCRRSKPRGTIASMKKMRFYRANPNTDMHGDGSWSYPAECPPVEVGQDGKELK